MATGGSGGPQGTGMGQLGDSGEEELFLIIFSLVILCHVHICIEKGGKTVKKNEMTK